MDFNLVYGEFYWMYIKKMWWFKKFKENFDDEIEELDLDEVVDDDEEEYEDEDVCLFIIFKCIFYFM